MKHHRSVHLKKITDRLHPGQHKLFSSPGTGYIEQMFFFLKKLLMIRVCLKRSQDVA